MAKQCKSRRRTPQQKISDLTDTAIRNHLTIDECLSRLELIAMQFGYHAEMFRRLEMPRSSTASAKLSDQTEEFCRQVRTAHGFNNDIPF